MLSPGSMAILVSEDGVLDNLGDLILDVAPTRSVFVHVDRQLALDVLNMVGVGQGVLGEDVHQLEEVVLDLVRLFIVGPVDCSKATVNVSRSNQGQAALEHFLEDDLTDSGLLLHVLLHELDEE